MDGESVIRCISCGREYDLEEIIYTCRECGSVLEVECDVEVSRDVFRGRRQNMWRYREFMPVDPSRIVSLDEGGTPFVRCDTIGSELGIELYVKVEGSNPTGSFKDRGMSVGITKALELGVDTVGCASTGNTSASLAAYAARAGLGCVVLLPSGKVALGKLAQAMFHGARVLSVRGNFDEALEAVTELALMGELYLLNSVNPFRLEGQKSIGFEIVDDLGWESPDRIILPVGNAGNISAIWKGISEFYRAGFIDERPMMTGIQAEGASPVVEAFRKGRTEIEPVRDPETVATAIRIGAPVSYLKALRAIYESDGYAESVTDEEILSAQKLLARREGIGVEPASAASIAGLIKLVDEGVVDRGERVVCVVTGHVLKDPDTAIKASTEPVEVEPDINQLRSIIRGTGSS
ncbi:MAG: threonine synthase [Methanothermobacter sp.]|jgi:threonine synthase|uniref:Threonine synthase n=2 Tax=Methanothermobacter TaxID=145260 RepID=O26354_METTH|nr:threonine synthase [Methanothermobacter thermautotrophicus str. Delta H]MDK2874758.1 threonine synthase [Methanothermobacter sp.]MDN5373632.1 threonine synthase [Methanothermobacter sp.]REE29061.1 L-threonine synthase [Methanothermobacter defluvii]BAZ98308.1 Threonine synthase [Methanothermobacter sp. EMTCatA1]